MAYNPVRQRAYYLIYQEQEREYARQWRKNNRDKVKAQKRRPGARASASRYYYRHQEKLNERAKIWQAIHSERSKANSKAYYEQRKLSDPNYNKKRAQKYSKQLAEQQKKRRAKLRLARQESPELDKRERERQRVSTQLWRIKNPDKVKLKGIVDFHRRKARLIGNGGSFSAKNIEILEVRQKGKCYWCGKPYGKFHIDHIWPVAKGGSNGPGNICLACPPCNLSKHDKTPMEFAGRLF